MACGFGKLPRSNKKIFHLAGEVMIDCVEFVGNMQGVCIRFAFISKLVGNGRNDTGLSLRFLELSRAEKVAT